MKAFAAAAVALALAAGPTWATEQMEVCAKEGAGKSYKVQATLATGQELNTATRTLNYTAWSKYVVIFWQQNQASVIELDFPFLNALGTDGHDQQGRRWTVSDNVILCF